LFWDTERIRLFYFSTTIGTPPGKAIKKAGIKKFVFHNYRNTALTSWARRGINVDVAMKASGHSSVQMHKRYVDLQDNDVANAFGTAYCKQNCNQNAEKSSQTSLSA
jgi:integrase